MTIDTRDDLIKALGNNSSRIAWDKVALSNTASGQFHSLWRATGQPGQGAIPTAVAVCDHTLTGAIGFAQQTAPATSYLGHLEPSANTAITVEIHDRLVHMGGLSGIVTAAQTVNLDLSTLLATSNLDARKGDANYSDVQWWLEWYADTGGTVATATVNVTYADGSTGNLTAVSLAATRRASFMQPLNGLIPAAASGKFIRGANNVTLSVSTGTAGNFGVTATRYRAGMFIPTASARFTADWAALGLPEIYNSSCLELVEFKTATNTTTHRGTGKIVHG